MLRWLLRNSVTDSDRKSLTELIQRLGVKFRDKSLLDIALLHRSYSTEHQIHKDNERLEFLGDSILNACVSEILYKMFPEKNEGELTKIRSRLVSRSALKKWGESIGLGEFIMLSDTMKQNMLRRHTHIVDNAMEAIIGAVYLDRGYDVVYEFVRQYMEKQDFHRVVDFKSKLQEITVAETGEFPEYRTVSEEGLPHQKEFTVVVLVKGKVMGKGKGRSKKSAQQIAAEKAFKKISKEEE